MIRIVLAGLREPELKAVQAAVNSNTNMEIVGCGIDGADAILKVKSLKPNIVLLDEQLSLLNAADATISLKRASPKTQVIILTNHCENELVLRAIYNGAAGYLIKRMDLPRLPWRIRIVCRGYSLMSPEIAAKAYQQALRPALSQGKKRQFPKDVSQRELKLIAYIGRGLSNKGIAQRLRLTEGTVRNCLSGVFQKTGLKNRSQLAIYAHKMGLHTTD
ncbi:MAG: response regulator transcription factor [Treponema sp.]|nr:response regulator transcription factor [Treponema sp.]